MNRVLWIELRRSAAAGTALALLLCGVLLLYSAPRVWATGWMPLAMAQRQYLVLLWPLALAAGAWQARREQRSNVAELFASTARPLAQRVAPTLVALAIAVVFGYLAMAATAVPWIIDTAKYVSAATFAVVGVGAVALIAAAWLGLAVGRLVPSVVTAPALAVAGLGLLMVSTPDQPWLAALVSPTRGLGLFDDFRTVSGRVSAAQGIWMAALAGTGAVLLAAGDRRTRALALLPAVIGAAVAFAVVPRDGDAAGSPLDPAARQLVCTEAGPRVCISRMHAGLLPEITPLARQGLALLAKLPAAPTSAVEDTNTFLDQRPQRQRADTVFFRVTIGPDGHLAGTDKFLPQLLDAAGVSTDYCPGDVSVPVSRAAAYWLMEREPPDNPEQPADVNAQTRTLWQTLRQLPDREAADRVATVRAAALACQDLTGLLTRSAG